MRFLTVTPNPSIDHTVELAKLTRGEVHRALSGTAEAGGKGVNVARVLAAHGHDATAVLPSGGVDGDRLETLLAPQQVRAATVAIAGAIRTNTTIVEADGTTTKLNEPGPELTDDDVEALCRRVSDALGNGADWLVSSGSLPPGAPADLHARFVREAHDRGVRTAVDTSGAALAAAVEAAPDVLKPNQEELAELVGRELLTVGDVVTAARELRAAGVGEVLVSLGGAGALLVADDVLWAGGETLVPLSTVAAGDCTLAGFLDFEGTAAQRLSAAVAWGRAAVLLPGSTVPRPEHTRTATAAVRTLTNPDPETLVKDLQR